MSNRINIESHNDFPSQVDDGADNGGIGVCTKTLTLGDF
jgi:hypothetical protein